MLPGADFRLAPQLPPPPPPLSPFTFGHSRTVFDREKPLPPMPREHVALSEIKTRVERDFRSSWIDIHSDSEDTEDISLQYLRDHPSAALPPSPMSPGAYGRPRAPTPSASIPPLNDDLWSSRSEGQFPPMSSSSTYLSESPLSLNSPSSSPALSSQAFSHSPLLRSVSEGETSFLSDPPPRSFARPPKSMPLPDPSQFPDPYPFRPPHHHLTSTLPALSSAGSSSTSTRSSAYTSSGSALASGDYGHVHVASGEEDTPGGTGITSDAVVQLLASDSATSSSSRGSQSRIPIDQTRWSESYSASIRSRSSSVGNSNSNNSHENAPPRLHEKPSYDMGWQTVDERDEVGMSEEDTDDEHAHGDEDEEEEEKEEERTSAVVIAEEGRGLIVQGDGVPIVQLQVHPGTTHLIIGSSTTPNAMPSFLTTTIPRICHTLLALDISANFLGALPPCLALCLSLEELNIASNPLRVLPVFLSDLTSLRVLIADSTGISTLPDPLANLDKLHTVSVRRNKMHSLPSWLCLLPALQTLYVDGNPFQGPWKALVEPLLAKVPMTPVYPPSTPMFPMLSADLQSSYASTEADGTDVEDLSDPPSSDPNGRFPMSPEEEEHTITPERAPFLGRATTAPLPGNTPAPQERGLTRTRTTPNRAFHNQNRAKSSAPTIDPRTQFAAISSKPHDASGQHGDRELRKMKSAGDLRRGKSVAPPPIEQGMSTPSTPALGHYAASLSSSNLLSVSPPAPERPSMSKRYASLGPATAFGSPSRNASGSRTALTKSLWDSISENEDDSSVSPASNRVSSVGGNTSPPHKMSNPGPQEVSDHRALQSRHTKDAKEKGSRWGFLKKMSMGKIKPDSPSRPSTAQGRLTTARPHTSAGLSSAPDRFSKTPRIDLRFSTTGNLDALSPLTSPSPASPQLTPDKNPSMDAPKVSASAPSPNLLAPPSPLPRSAKRRSFLPIEAPSSLNIPIPDASTFIPGVTATNGVDDPDPRTGAPSPVTINEQYLRREERAREAYMRALRSVMAYLKDMNDLGLSQSNPMSMYGSSADEMLTTRSRRPTVVDGTREVSMALSGSTAVASLDSYGHLRSTESMAGLRSGSSTQTMSVATTDSSGSSEERKFKDDKGKRAMVVREIVATERTYVKGLEELVDIYIKPGCAPANVLSGVGSSKDTVVPAPERKIVFSGVDALFSFHKDSFLPALEVAAAPLMKTTAELQEADADGQLSLDVAKAVGSMFLKHAAFMRMYSSYINNFDNSVQRVKYWTSDRPPTGNISPSVAISPSSSTAQLVGLGLAMSTISSPGLVPEGGPAATGVPNLTTSQKRRIRSYLKRCRMSPRHSQLNLEGYLLLPVQRIPRYRLLLEELLRSTPPTYEYMDDPLDRALEEISSLANNMNEGKRESESRRKLVQWQARIRGKFPSPLVQPHRRLIMDGPLLLTRVVRKAMVSFEAINAQGDASTVQVDCLAPELTPRPLIGILCNDLLVLCRDPSEGHDPTCSVDLWAVLRMQTLPQPASIVHGNALRLVDNKAILYFDAPSPSDALNWYRAINLHIPASKT